MSPANCAYGIPQAQPGSRMASVAPDWTTGPFTQITLGEEYIQGTWGDPQNARANEQQYHWYGSAHV